MKNFHVDLLGFSGEILFTMETPAFNRQHAIMIAGAHFYHCYRRAECLELRSEPTPAMPV